jgi:hypothetical protein
MKNHILVKIINKKKSVRKIIIQDMNFNKDFFIQK